MKNVADKVRKLIKVQYCCDELIKAGKAWLESMDTDQFAGKTEELIAELEEDIIPIDDLIHYC